LIHVIDENGRPVHSWRVLILSFVEEQQLYDAYDLSAIERSTPYRVTQL
jgi:hypothetical protein